MRIQLFSLRLLHFVGEFLKALRVEVPPLGLPVKATNEMITTQNTTPGEKNVHGPSPSSLKRQILLGQYKECKASDEERVHEDEAEWFHSIPVPIPPGQSDTTMIVKME